MSVAVEEHNGRPFRVPGYAGYVPGLKYAFGHTYGYDESRLFKSQHSNLKKGDKVENFARYQPLFGVPKSESCIERNSIHQKLSKVEGLQSQQRKVQWTNEDAEIQQQQHGMETVEPQQQPQKNVSVQCTIEEAWGKDEEREGLRSAATQWSDQEAHRKKKFSTGTQWTPADFSPLKTIPGYTGHLPGRHYVNPGKSFSQEMNALLPNFNPKAAVVPISRHMFTSALQQKTNNKPEGKNDPYFDNRPPSTYLNNYPIPGYQGFVPRVRTSTSSLGIRYIKAVEKSLHALHEQKQHKNIEEEEYDDEITNSPKKLLDKRPLHTPRHRPHPKNQPQLNEDDWRVVYQRPPSTYLDSSKTFIPGYKGFIPHLRGSPNAVGVRYSKAALRCVEKSLEKQGKSETAPNKLHENTAIESERPLENRESEEDPKHYQSNTKEDLEDQKNSLEEDQITREEKEIEDQIQDYGDAGSDSDNVNEEVNNSYATESDRLQRRLSDEILYRTQHSDYLQDRKPSTYKSDERHPIPGYQGFIPRLRDSPTTLGLRYTKAALKTLEDIHRNQKRTRER